MQNLVSFPGSRSGPPFREGRGVNVINHPGGEYLGVAQSPTAAGSGGPGHGLQISAGMVDRLGRGSRKAGLRLTGANRCQIPSCP
jgi:hypothetical protein